MQGLGQKMLSFNVVRNLAENEQAETISVVCFFNILYLRPKGCENISLEPLVSTKNKKMKIHFIQNKDDRLGGVVPIHENLTIFTCVRVQHLNSYIPLGAYGTIYKIFKQEPQEQYQKQH